MSENPLAPERLAELRKVGIVEVDNVQPRPGLCVPGCDVERRWWILPLSLPTR